MRRYVAWGLWLAGTLWLVDCAASNIPEDDGTSCPVGSERCPCTNGGACDSGLECLSGLCVDPTPGNGGAGGATSTGGGFSNGSGGQTNCDMGCKKLDILFSIDHSQSMAQEVTALAATQAFTEVINTIAAVNCGDIEFRVGLTDDNDR
ncbi:MAG TPA: hypothetical protein VFB62_26295, partial [Polyangiaceae bacterium]|nr:hypothetical protein [Polyangiaceae bacterium]